MLRALFTRSPPDPGGGWDAVRAANDLARQGRSDAECLEILQAEHRPEALLWGAKLLQSMGKGDIYRARTASRLGRAAGQKGAGQQQWGELSLPPSILDLPSMPVPAAFAELVERVPALEALATQARRIAASPRFERVPSELGDDLLLHPSPQSTLVLRPLLRRARRLVGPRAASDDPVVASTEAEWVVQRYLLSVLESPEPHNNGNGSPR